jgi:type III secretion protein Q
MSSGFAALRPGLLELGAQVADAAARSASALLGLPVRVSGRPVPGRPAPRAGVGQVALDLASLPGVAQLEVDAALVVAVVDRLAGGDGHARPASRLTPVEAAALDLVVLSALDGVCGLARVEAALSPRLGVCGASAPEGALAVELALSAGPATGRGRLLVPAAAVRALGGGECGTSTGLRIGASLRMGSALLSAAERDGLEVGDVLVLDRGQAGALVLPGGARLEGRLGDEGLTVESEVDMDARNVSIPVALEVELARVEVTLGELLRLEPGAVLPLAIDRSGRVALVAGERTVARGELVEVEGAVGLRILELLP